MTNNHSKVFHLAGKWSNGNITMTKNGATTCSGIGRTGLIGQEWYVGTGEIVNQNVVHNGACSQVSDLRTCTGYKNVFPN